METLPPPKCPECNAELKLTSKGQLDFWSCCAGHGLGFTLDEAYGRVQDDEIAKIWHGSETAPAGKRPCPMCGAPMVVVKVGVDADEAAEGEPGDRPDTAAVQLDVCRQDEFFWFDAGELDRFPQDLPNAEPTPEEQKKIDAIMSAFDKELAEGYEEEESRGILNEFANHIVRRHPGFAHSLEHAMYGDKLDKLEAETKAEHRKLEAEWSDNKGGA